MKLLFSTAAMICYIIAIILLLKSVANPSMPGFVLTTMVFLMARGLTMVRKEMRS